MFVVIAYDCTSDKRRLKVANILLDYGYRVQYSVFEADLDQALLAELERRLGAVVNPREDSVRIYHICRKCLEQTSLFGTAELTNQKSVFII